MRWRKDGDLFPRPPPPPQYIYIYICCYHQPTTCKVYSLKVTYVCLNRYVYNINICQIMGHTRWSGWLRHCVTSRKDVASVSDGAIENFHWHNPTGLIMDLGSTRPLREMRTKNTFWGVKAVGEYSWQPNHLPAPTVLKSGSLSLLEPSGCLQACNGIVLPLPNYTLCRK